MVEDALREGKSIEFFRQILKYDIELWKNKYLFDIIANDTVYATSDRCDAHYDLVRDIINMSIESHISFWQDDDTLRQWIHLLVEQKYPWFVCSRWNHLRPTAISFLHDASMMHCHTGNLHQLLRQHCISSLWEDDDFMHSVENQEIFFNTLEKGKNKSFLKTVKTQLSHYPYTDPDCVRVTIEALCLRKSVKIFAFFVNHEHAQHVKDEHAGFILLNLCANGMVSLFEDMFHQMYNDECTPPVNNWVIWFHHIYGRYSSSSWKERSSRSDLRDMFMSLLKIFDICMPSQAWCELLTNVSDVPILQMCMHTKYANKLYTQILFYLRKAIQSLPDTFTSVIVSSTDNEQTTIEWSSIEQEKDFFLIVDSLLMSSQGWTSFANALRWGNRECVQWMFEQCKEDDKSFLLNTLCKTSSNPTRYDNPLTLAMYNPDLSILHSLIYTVNDDKQLHDWCCQCECRSIITALARVSFFHTKQQVKQRWELITTIHPSIKTYKSVMVEAFLDEWHQHTRVSYPGYEYNWNELEETFLFQEIMQLSYPLDVPAAQYALTSVSSGWSAFHRRFKTILKYGGMEDVIGTYNALVSTECVCLPHLFAFESYDVFKHALIHTNAQLYKMVFAWSQRPMKDLRYFIIRLTDRLNQNIHAILPSDYSYYACTDYCIYADENPLKEQWSIWLKYGLMPLIMYRSNSTTSVPNILNITLKAYRMLRRCLQRRWKKLHASKPLYINHKKLMFMVRCDDSLFHNKR